MFICELLEKGEIRTMHIKVFTILHSAAASYDSSSVHSINIINITFIPSDRDQARSAPIPGSDYGELQHDSDCSEQ